HLFWRDCAGPGSKDDLCNLSVWSDRGDFALGRGSAQALRVAKHREALHFFIKLSFRKVEGSDNPVLKSSGAAKNPGDMRARAGGGGQVKTGVRGTIK